VDCRLRQNSTGWFTTGTTTTGQTVWLATTSGRVVTEVPRTLLFVGIVNDFPVVTAGVALLLHPYRHRVRVEEFVGELPARGRVDVVLFDPFARSDALQRLRTIQRETAAKVLLYTWSTSQALIDDAMRCGAAGLLPKTVDGQVMVSAIEAVADGQMVAPRPVQADSPMAEWPGKIEGLSAREAEIVALIVAGISNEEIARSTYLSINSVKTYIRTAYRKMGVSSRSQAVLWGIRHGLQSQESPDGPNEGLRDGLRDGLPDGRHS